MKNIISEISKEERNRILEMHKKATTNQYLVNEQGDEPIGMANPATTPIGGPLTGVLVNQLGEKTVSWGDTIEFNFKDLKNSGKGPLTINKIVPRSSNMMVDAKLPITLAPGQSFNLRVKAKMVQGGTTTRPDQNGVMNYDVPVFIYTDGKKEMYQLYCRATLQLQ
jgi:hypothetical protein